MLKAYIEELGTYISPFPISIPILLAMNADNKWENLEKPVTEGESLAIPNSEFKAPRGELWERRARFVPKSLPIDGTPTICFEILTARIISTDVEDNIKRYVVYELNVRKDTKFDIDDHPAIIRIRYTDFRDLFQRLKRDHPKYMASIIFPNKILIGNFSKVLIAERRACKLFNEVACTTTPNIHQSAERWASLALDWYETLCDIDMLPLYIPLLNTCEHLWLQRGLDVKPIKDCLKNMSRKGINVRNVPSLMLAIHAVDAQSVTVEVTLP